MMKPAGIIALGALVALGACSASDHSDAIEEAIVDGYAEREIEVTSVEMTRDEEGDGYSGTATVIDPATGEETEISCSAVPTEGTEYDWTCDV